MNKLTKKILIKEYKTKSLNQIAEKYHTNYGVIYKLFLKYNIKRRNSNELIGILASHYIDGKFIKKERHCLDCGKKLNGHNNPIRCKNCYSNYQRTGRKYPKCLDCGKTLKTYHSVRCKRCSHLGERTGSYIDGRTLKKDYQNKYTKNRRLLDLNFRVSGNLRSRIRIALKGIYKSSTTKKLIGCSIDKLKKYLESKFKLGMNWSNYGKWHVDHIKPCISFDLSKKSEQRKCFHYKNLQPLWAEDNLKKNDSIN
jgi:hypothetical protein